MTSQLTFSGNPESDAQSLLDKYWSFGSPVTVPVDPIYIAQSAGLEVWEAHLSEVGGMLVKQPRKAAPEIYLSISDPRVRQRFTCAHELGHWMKRLSNPEGDWAFVDKRNQLSGAGVDSSEMYANQFAAALLMPAGRVRQLAQGMRLDQLAAAFNVSVQAMSFRLRNLGVHVRG